MAEGISDGAFGTVIEAAIVRSGVRVTISRSEWEDSPATGLPAGLSLRQ